MLHRTKYSRLRNDSLTSLEDRPQGSQTLKGLPSDPACVDSQSVLDQGSSTLKGFIPRMSGMKLHSPVSLWTHRGQTQKQGDRTPEGPSDRGLRLCTQTSLPVPLTLCHSQTPSALRCTKRPITLHRMASLPWNPGFPLCSHQDSVSCPKSCSVLGPGNPVVRHHLKYMGSLEVTQSMRSLDFYTRMQVTREAISRLCERTLVAKAAAKDKRPLPKALCAVLGQSNQQHSGSRVILTVSADSVTVITACSSQTIAHHPMQSISFASGGDPDMADFIAYVAKDPDNQRACHILKCPHGGASEVIDSLGQAFETRFRLLLSQTSSVLPPLPSDWSSEEIKRTHEDKDGYEHKDHDYYNEIPGKAPPPGGIQDMRLLRGPDGQVIEAQKVCLSEPVSLYENCSNTEETVAPSAETTPETSIDLGDAQTASQPFSDRLIQDLIMEEGWFHGRLDRGQAEALLSSSGDFLVRESSSATGQYVLSGMEGGSVRHLLLVDPHGQVRTRDQVFLSVSDLVRFHMESQMPIISGSTELCLRQPILQRH